MFNALIVFFYTSVNHNFTLIDVAWLRSLNQLENGVDLGYTLVNCSVKATIDRYKKASSDSSNTGSTSEANTQVFVLFNFTKFREEWLFIWVLSMEPKHTSKNLVQSKIWWIV